MLVGSVLGGVIAQATDLGVPYVLRAAMLGRDARRGVPVHARHRLHAAARAPTPIDGRPQRPPRLDRRRLAQPAGALADARCAVHDRRRLLRVLRDRSRTCSSCTATRRRTASPAWPRPSSRAPRSSAACSCRRCVGCSADAPTPCSSAACSTSHPAGAHRLDERASRRPGAARPVGAGLRLSSRRSARRSSTASSRRSSGRRCCRSTRSWARSAGRRSAGAWAAWRRVRLRSVRMSCRGRSRRLAIPFVALARRQRAASDPID